MSLLIPLKRQFPNFDGVIVATGVECRVVAGQSQSAYAMGVASQCRGAGLVGKAPDLDGAVPAARVKGGVAIGQRQGADTLSMTCERSGAAVVE